MSIFLEGISFREAAPCEGFFPSAFSSQPKKRRRRHADGDQQKQHFSGFSVGTIQLSSRP